MLKCDHEKYAHILPCSPPQRCSQPQPISLVVLSAQLCGIKDLLHLLITLSSSVPIPVARGEVTDRKVDYIWPSQIIQPTRPPVQPLLVTPSLPSRSPSISKWFSKLRPLNLCEAAKVFWEHVKPFWNKDSLSKVQSPLQKASLSYPYILKQCKHNPKLKKKLQWIPSSSNPGHLKMPSLCIMWDLIYRAFYNPSLQGFSPARKSLVFLDI